MHIIQVSIPLFFLLIAPELLWSQRTGRRVVRLNDALSDLSCGILSQLAGILSKVFTVGIFIWVGERFALQRFIGAVPAWPSGAPFASASGVPGFTVDLLALVSWSAVFILVDLCYYWSHRLSHEVHLLWAGHVVHHSSEEYNLPVALRQSALHGLMSWVFFFRSRFSVCRGKCSSLRWRSTSSISSGSTRGRSRRWGPSPSMC